jgi:hypothetical protein
MREEASESRMAQERRAIIDSLPSFGSHTPESPQSSQSQLVPSAYSPDVSSWAFSPPPDIPRATPHLKEFRDKGIFWSLWCSNELLYTWRDLEALSKPEAMKLIGNLATASTAKTRRKALLGTAMEIGQREGGNWAKDILIDFVEPWYEYNSRVGYYPGRGAAEQLFPKLDPTPRHPWERQHGGSDILPTDAVDWQGKWDLESPVRPGKALTALWDYYRKDLTPADFRREALGSVKDQCTAGYTWTKDHQKIKLSLCGWMKGSPDLLSRRQQLDLFYKTNQGLLSDPWTETTKVGRGLMGQIDIDF